MRRSLIGAAHPAAGIYEMAALVSTLSQFVPFEKATIGNPAAPLLT
jgi:hypothetical protein